MITDANGQVTFPATDVALGASYFVTVLPVQHEGIQLARSFGAVFTNGTSASFVQNVALSDIVPGANEGLYIVSASNLDPNNVQADGVVIYTFSKAVTLVDENLVTATIISGQGSITALTPTTAANSDTTAVVSSPDGLTLTLTPVFSAGPTPLNLNYGNVGNADNALTVQFANLFVRLQQPNDTSVMYNVLALTQEAGGTNNGQVLVTPAF